MITKKERAHFKDFMHGFACTSAQHQAIVEMARESQVTQSEVLRQMVDFFLFHNPRKTQMTPTNNEGSKDNDTTE